VKHDNNRRYDYFKYQLPDKSATHYANNALKILREIKREFPDLFHIFRAPSEILTLSGVRAIDAYNRLGRIDAATITGIKGLLMQHHQLLFEEAFSVVNGKDRDNLFLLVNLDALATLPKTYGYIPCWQKPVIRHTQDGKDFVLWWELWKIDLSQRLVEDTKLPVGVWLKDSYAPHNMTFGMLLGYPGEAIASSLWGEEDKLMEARIKYAREYTGPVPIYDYAQELKDNPNILAHEKLWSEILTKVYTELKKV
jgi:hypothetical protein